MKVLLYFKIFFLVTYCSISTVVLSMRDVSFEIPDGHRLGIVSFSPVIGVRDLVRIQKKIQDQQLGSNQGVVSDLTWYKFSTYNNIPYDSLEQYCIETGFSDKAYRLPMHKLSNERLSSWSAAFSTLLKSKNGENIYLPNVFSEEDELEWHGKKGTISTSPALMNFINLINESLIESGDFVAVANNDAMACPIRTSYFDQEKQYIVYVVLACRDNVLMYEFRW